MTGQPPSKNVWDQLRVGPNIVMISFGNAARDFGIPRSYDVELASRCTQGIANILVRTRDDLVPREGQLQMTPQGELIAVMMIEKLPPEKRAEWRRQKEAAGYLPKAP